MLKSETITSIAPALVAAQEEFRPIALDATAQIPTKSGGNYTYSYATLGTIMTSIQPILTKHKLAVVQIVTIHPSVQTIVVHESGEWIGNEIPITASGGSQAVGSEISYARRYGLSSLLALVTYTDDDGAAAQKAHDDGSTAHGRTSTEPCSPAQNGRIWAMANELWPGNEPASVRALLAIECRNLGVPDNSRDMSKAEASRLIDHLQKRLDALAGGGGPDEY